MMKKAKTTRMRQHWTEYLSWGGRQTTQTPCVGNEPAFAGDDTLSLLRAYGSVLMW